MELQTSGAKSTRKSTAFPPTSLTPLSFPQRASAIKAIAYTSTLPLFAILESATQRPCNAFTNRRRPRAN